MKKILIISVALLLSNPAFTNAGVELPSDSIQQGNKVEAIQIKNRISEIYAMNKTSLTKSERKVLRQEVKSKKERLREVGGGIYISGTAIIIILLLIILI